MKPELSVAYLHSIESDPIPRLIAMSAAAWTDDWKSRVEAALDSDLVGLPLYDAWPTSRAIPKEEWDAKLNANWALDLPEAYVFETGSNRWTTYDAWPPKAAQAVRYFLQENETLSANPLPGTTSLSPFDEYLSDPANPVPYTEDVHLGRSTRFLSPVCGRSRRPGAGRRICHPCA